MVRNASKALPKVHFKTSVTLRELSPRKVAPGAQPFAAEMELKAIRRERRKENVTSFSDALGWRMTFQETPNG